MITSTRVEESVICCSCIPGIDQLDLAVRKVPDIACYDSHPIRTGNSRDLRINNIDAAAQALTRSVDIGVMSCSSFVEGQDTAVKFLLKHFVRPDEKLISPSTFRHDGQSV